MRWIPPETGLLSEAKSQNTIQSKAAVSPHLRTCSSSCVFSVYPQVMQ